MSKKRPNIKQKLIEIDTALFDRVVVLAAKEHRSINGEIVHLLEHAILTQEVFIKKRTDKEMALYQSLTHNDNITAIQNKVVQVEEEEEEIDPKYLDKDGNFDINAFLSDIDIS